MLAKNPNILADSDTVSHIYRLSSETHAYAFILLSNTPFSPF